MTTTDMRTPAQKIDDKRDARRHPLIEALRWIEDRPPSIHLADTRPVIANLVGHDITDQDVFDAMLRLRVRDAYRDDDQNPDLTQARLDAALDVLLDLAECDGCHELHPADEVRSCDHGTFSESCFADFHDRRACPSERI